ncbi:hypothetical protein BDY24DRAFT_396086 [Mrakia frigida]|uniref:Log1p n=1 Tax=Mrakia frigida TaxID=29902 RepID=UPI003FCC1FF9
MVNPSTTASLSPKAPVCVFCASSLGTSPIYAAAAISLGRSLALSSTPLIYGGGSKGLMGLVASSALENGGQVHGIIPKAFLVATNGEKGEGASSQEEEIGKGKTVNLEGHKSKVTVVGGMHERKTLMSKLSTGGFITLPGGFGTFEEVMEMTTWSQLGIHATPKPIVVLSVGGFFAPLKEQCERAVKAGFIAEKNLSFLKFVDGPDDADWGALAMQALDEWVWDAEAGYRGLDWETS